MSPEKSRINLAERNIFRNLEASYLILLLFLKNLLKRLYRCRKFRSFIEKREASFDFLL